MRGNTPKPGSSQLFTVDIDRANPKVWMTGMLSDFLSQAWSPDGSTIMFGNGGGHRGTLSVLSLATGKSKPFFQFSNGADWPESLTWMPDGRTLIVLDRNVENSRIQLVSITYPGAQLHPITNDVNSYSSVSVTADGSSLLATVVQTQSIIQVLHIDGPMADDHLQTFGPAYWVSWLDNDHLLSFERENGIYSVSLFSVNRSPFFTSNRVTPYSGEACGDHSVAFYAAPKGSMDFATHIYLVDRSGGNLRQIGQGDEEEHPHCSPDGKWLIYFDFADLSLRRRPLTGGPSEVLLTKETGVWPNSDVSRDGKELLAAIGETGAAQFAILSLDSGKITQQLPMAANTIADPYPVFTPDGKGIAHTHLSSDGLNIWIQPRSGFPAYQLTKFVQTAGPTRTIRGIHWSPDRQEHRYRPSRPIRRRRPPQRPSQISPDTCPLAWGSKEHRRADQNLGQDGRGSARRPRELGRTVSAVRFKKSESVRLRKQSLRRKWSGNGKTVLGTL